MLKSAFRDLALRSGHNSSTIDKKTFLKFMQGAPGVLGERMFAVFDRYSSFACVR